eukprot:s104_g37.t1
MLMAQFRLPFRNIEATSESGSSDLVRNCALLKFCSLNRSLTFLPRFPVLLTPEVSFSRRFQGFMDAILFVSTMSSKSYSTSCETSGNTTNIWTVGSRQLLHLLHFICCTKGNLKNSSSRIHVGFWMLLVPYLGVMKPWYGEQQSVWKWQLHTALRRLAPQKDAKQGQKHPR